MSPTVTSRVRQRVAATVAALLVAAATLLVVGVLLERHVEAVTGHPPAAATSDYQDSHHDESTEGTHAESGIPAVEPVHGVGIESPWIVTLRAIASIALAVAVWRHPTRPVIAVVVAFTAAALVLDVIEILHQLGEGRIVLAALAGVIIALRVATIGAAYLLRARRVST
jgi:hypothetical protein